MTDPAHYDLRRVHLIGIGGSGMSGLARILATRGAVVTGSDVKDSTPVEVLRTMGAKVNGRLVPLESELKSGDVVEVFTSKNPDAGPSQDWLGFVKSTRARNKIRGWFTKERREEAIEKGKDSLAKTLRKQGLPLQRLMSHESLTEVATRMNHADIDALYAAIGDGHVSTEAVMRALVKAHGGEEAATEDLAEATTPRTAPRSRAGDPGVTVVGTSITDTLTDAVTIGVIAGLVLGKAVGIFGSTFLVSKFTRAELDDNLTWSDVFGLSLLGGIGFTVSLLIGELAFGSGSSADDHVKIGVLLGSLLSAALASIVLARRNRVYAQLAEEEERDDNHDGVPDVYQRPSTA